MGGCWTFYYVYVLGFQDSLSIMSSHHIHSFLPFSPFSSVVAFPWHWGMHFIHLIWLLLTCNLAVIFRLGQIYFSCRFSLTLSRNIPSRSNRNFYWKFISHYSDLARPLNDLTKKDKRFEWTTKCQKFFDTLKTWFTEEPVLMMPNQSRPF